MSKFPEGLMPFRRPESIGEAVDPAEEYLRKYLNDSENYTDDAESYLNMLISDAGSRLVIKTSALKIYASTRPGLPVGPRTRRYIEEYVKTFSDALKDESC